MQEAGAAAPVATTDAGKVRGVWRSHGGTDVHAGRWHSAAFLGIPFAQAPVGPLRFAAPVPHTRWTGVRDATTYGPTPQRGAAAGITLIPEPSVPGDSTLNVNVFTPDPGAAAALPVLVYIHGGGFTSGSTASPWYDGAAFNRDGIVTVSLSYRIGFAGFGAVAGAPANRGVLDWLAGLEWVHRNIAAFGGDPARVTLVGQSAGGGAVMTLLALPAAQHLFAGVHAMSAAVTDIPLPRAQALAARLAKLAGVAANVAGFSAVPEERLLELTPAATRSPQALRSAGKMLARLLANGSPLGPAVDGTLIVRPTLESLRLGIGADKPLVMGTTDDEFSTLLDRFRRVVDLVPSRALLALAGLPRAGRTEYLAANQDVAQGGPAAVLGRYVTDSVFRQTVLRVADARAAAGAAPTYLYRFAWRSPVKGRAVHCLDVPFFFDVLHGEGVAALAGATPPQQLADEVHGCAAAFIRSGDPAWPAYTEPGRAVQRFDVPTAVQPDGYASVRMLARP